MSFVTYITLLFAASWCATGVFRWYAVDYGLLDTPNDRSSHNRPTPRGGGFPLILVWISTLAYLWHIEFIKSSLLILFLPAICIAYLGYKDDRVDLSAKLRLFIHLLLAYVFIELLGLDATTLVPFTWLQDPLIAKGVVVVSIAWCINLVNFMDGTDGIASQEAIFFFVIGGYFLYQSPGGYEFALLSWGLGAIWSAFLLWNWPPASIFMGDCGSCFLGFMMATFALIGFHKLGIPIIPWIILSSLFWFDATVTLLRRMFNGDPWMKPHRKHAFQRLIQHGWSHLNVLLCAITFNTVLSLLALWAYKDPSLSKMILGITVMLISCCYVVVEIIKPMYDAAWYKNSTV